jgi:hypothetical protein
MDEIVRRQIEDNLAPFRVSHSIQKSLCKVYAEIGPDKLRVYTSQYVPFGANSHHCIAIRIYLSTINDFNFSLSELSELVQNLYSVKYGDIITDLHRIPIERVDLGVTIAIVLTIIGDNIAISFRCRNYDAEIISSTSVVSLIALKTYYAAQELERQSGSRRLFTETCSIDVVDSERIRRNVRKFATELIHKPGVGIEYFRAKKRFCA